MMMMMQHSSLFPCCINKPGVGGTGEASTTAAGAGRVGEEGVKALPARAASLLSRRFSRAGRPPFLRRRLVWRFARGALAEAGGGAVGVGGEALLAGFCPPSSTAKLTHSAPS